ncbi:sugar nucleotide-binding protein [candidate division KSB1 bacterium]|nr:sugar nucleotide-binding protein [candidate division KSB1 bacterium]MBL7094103.1 sugar nucleotide-binding protein [candidate division KSB1 bacterium]
MLVTGITSIHGWPIFSKLQKLLPQDRLFGVAPPKSNFLDVNNIISFCITDKENLVQIKNEFRPTHVIHCAGVCDLDVCEDRPQWAYSLNVSGTKAVADVFGENASIIYMSTDLVFSGNNPPAGGYSEDHEPDPVSVAGKTFLEAEQCLKKNKNFCIIRLALPLGDSVNGEKGAIDWIDCRFKRNLPVTLFHDEYRSCITCEEIGEMAISVINLNLKGLFHFGGDKPWSLYNIGEYVLTKAGYSPDLLKGILRNQEKNGPPRIGDVSMNSSRLKNLIT